MLTLSHINVHVLQMQAILGQKDELDFSLYSRHVSKESIHRRSIQASEERNKFEEDDLMKLMPFNVKQNELND